MKKENVTLKGHAIVEEVNPETGETVSKERVDNVVVDTGAAAITDALASGTITPFDWMAIGNGETAGSSPAEGDSGLTTEQARSSQLSATQNDVSGTEKQIQYINTFPVGTGTSDISEMGMFDSSSGGTMLNHIIFGAEKDNANNDLQITYQLTVS